MSQMIAEISCIVMSFFCYICYISYRSTCISIVKQYVIYVNVFISNSHASFMGS